MTRSRTFRVEQRERVIKARVRLVQRVQPEAIEAELLCGKRPAQLAKRKPFDCGRTNCGVCRRYDRKGDHKRKSAARKVDE